MCSEATRLLRVQLVRSEPTDIAELGVGHAELLGADEAVTAQFVTAID